MLIGRGTRGLAGSIGKHAAQIWVTREEFVHLAIHMRIYGKQSSRMVFRWVILENILSNIFREDAIDLKVQGGHAHIWEG
jgi:hypothetical protein